jgi:hypothetical protein
LKITLVDFVRLLELRNTQTLTSNGLESWELHAPELKSAFCTEEYIYLIITEDIEGTTYGNFFEKNYENEDLIVNTLFDMIYGIYLMNDKLKIMHNDNHFNNVLIKTGIAEYESKYEIDKIEYIKRKNFKLCFYDFDLSFLENKPNPYLIDSSSTVQNVKSAKDIWTILNSINRFSYHNMNADPYKIEYFINKIFNIHLINPDYWDSQHDISKYRHLDYIHSLVFMILNYSPINIDKLENIFVDYVNNLNKDSQNLFYWNGYCKDNIQKPCIIPIEPTMYPLEVLKRFIKSDYFGKKLGFTIVNSFYKKYLRYKSKYLQLKNIYTIEDLK